MAQSGLGSRRACEEVIASGRVAVNGIPAKLGDKADPSTDRITLDGRPVRPAAEKIYIAINKPRGVLSTEDPVDPHPYVRNLVPVRGHLFCVGRLDLDSEGLILLTNDGELANRLTHPRYEHEKEYRVLVASHPDEEQLAIWRRGVVLPDGHRTAPAVVDVESTAGKGAWLKIILHEGRKRQIRETGRTIGLPVVQIIRLRIGSVLLGKLKPGEWRNLNNAEVAALKSLSAEENAKGRTRKPSRQFRQVNKSDKRKKVD